MTIASLLAASFTFTAVATGVEKGTAVEFAFVGANSDRDYEAMFMLEESVGTICKRLEAAGLLPGQPTDVRRCRLWPVGRALAFDPPIAKYIDCKMPEGLPEAPPVYTGGARLSDGAFDADENMPASLFSFYTLAQSPFVYNGIYDQGTVYGAFTARETLKKGTKVCFTVSWTERSPKQLKLTAQPGKGAELVNRLREEAKNGELDVEVGFDGSLTVGEAKSIACALSAIDSMSVKINGCSNFFYRAFMPLVKWTDRTQRLQQPFELTLGSPDKLVFIEEDWSAPGDDPKLTPHHISFSEAKNHPKTDTCFVYAKATNTVMQIDTAIRKMKNSGVTNWYVFDAQ